MNGQDTAELVVEDCRVPSANLLGEEQNRCRSTCPFLF